MDPRNTADRTHHGRRGDERVSEADYPTLARGLATLGITLTTHQWEQLDYYTGRLLEQNNRINLTGAHTREELEVRHLLDSFTVAPLLPANGATVADIGSGGGLPAIPLAILRQDLVFTLFEATGKKALFLTAVSEDLGLDHVRIINQRVELMGQTWEHRQRYDTVVARAVAELPILVELMLPLNRLMGTSIAMKKGDLDYEIARARRAIHVCGGELVGVQPAQGHELLADHQLIVLEKVAAALARYPRRPGVPQRQPIL